VHRLIAIDLPASDRFVKVVEHAWSEGDAVFPLDQRLSPTLRHGLARDFGAAAIHTESSTIEIDGGATMRPDEALVIATSGSTGTPKGVVHTHTSLSASADASANALGLSSDDHWLVCIPVSHIGGFSVITRARHTDAGLTLHETFFARRTEDAARAGCTHVSLVPTALRRIDPSVFRQILLGGQAAPPHLPPNVTVTYGSTETGGGIAYDGRALPGVDIRILDGEIQVKSSSLFARYIDGSDDKTRDGWFRTGDGGSLEDGRLDVTGRLTDMIVSGGENIWPQQIERVLRGISDVHDAVVVARDDAEWGQVVEAFLETSRSVTRDEVRDAVLAHLPSYCVPKKISCIATFPRGSSGKVDKHSLAMLAR
jgi:O-succinylbenzoic acid--CoA ligase